MPKPHTEQHLLHLNIICKYYVGSLCWRTIQSCLLAIFVIDGEQCRLLADIGTDGAPAKLLLLG